MLANPINFLPQRARALKQQELDAQRAAERAQQDAAPSFDLLGQSNLMASFADGGDSGNLEFELDEYGGGA